MTIIEPFHEHNKQNLMQSLPINSDIGVIIRKYAKGKYYFWFYVAELGLIQPLLTRDVASLTGFPRNSNNHAIIVKDEQCKNPNFLTSTVIRILATNLYGDSRDLTYSLLNVSG